MQVEDPAPSGGAEERRLRRMERSLARRGGKATPPFDLSQGRESFDPTQDREPVERLVERQMMLCW